MSSAGIYVKNEARVASLFIKVPENDYDAVRRIYIDAAKRLGAPVTVANDGDVAAMAGAISMDMKSVLGIAMGTSEAAGFVDDKTDCGAGLTNLRSYPSI